METHHPQAMPAPKPSAQPHNTGLLPHKPKERSPPCTQIWRVGDGKNTTPPTATHTQIFFMLVALLFSCVIPAIPAPIPRSPSSH